MKHDFLDRYSRLDSVVHRQSAALKLAGALVVVLATVIVPRTAWVFFGVTGLILLVLAGLSRLPALFLLRRMLTLEPEQKDICGLIPGKEFRHPEAVGAEGVFQPAQKLAVQIHVGVAVDAVQDQFLFQAGRGRGEFRAQPPVPGRHPQAPARLVAEVRIGHASVAHQGGVEVAGQGEVMPG